MIPPADATQRSAVSMKEMVGAELTRTIVKATRYALKHIQGRTLKGRWEDHVILEQSRFNSSIRFLIDADAMPVFNLL